MADLAKKKLAGRTGVFGSTTKRFHSTANTDVPGPGAYGSSKGQGGDDDEEDEGEQGRFTSAFASTTQRGLAAGRSEVPDPGAYDVGPPAPPAQAHRTR